MKTFKCVDCEAIREASGKGIGYTRRTEPNEYGPAGKVCYVCCGQWDLKYMQREGALILIIM